MEEEEKRYFIVVNTLERLKEYAKVKDRSYYAQPNPD